MFKYTILPNPQRILTDANITPNDLKVYTALCSFCNQENGSCYPTRRTISKICGIKILNNISRSITKLAKLGYITVMKHWDNVRKCFYNIYTIVFNLSCNIDCDDKPQKQSKENPEGGVSEAIRGGVSKAILHKHTNSKHNKKNIKKEKISSKEDEEVSLRLAKIIEKKRKVKISEKMINSWNENIRLLRTKDLSLRDDPQSDIMKALDRIEKYSECKYFPVILCTSALRAKFMKIENFDIPADVQQEKHEISEKEALFRRMYYIAKKPRIYAEHDLERLEEYQLKYKKTINSEIDIQESFINFFK